VTAPGKINRANSHISNGKYWKSDKALGVSSSSQAPARKQLLHRALQISGVVLALGSSIFWLSTGAHTGFTKHRVEIEKVDPITMIEYVDYEERFVMGVEYLSGGLVLGFALIALSIFLKRKE
jgi:hypothetical protein